MRYALCQTPVRPILPCGNESWVLKKIIKMCFERILRRTSGSIKENGTWRSWYNHELHNYKINHTE
jgi:hypothetical protein